MLVGARTPVATAVRPSPMLTQAAAPPKKAVFAAQPTRFEANVGQTDERVRYLARRGGSTLFLTDTGATLALRAKDDVTALSLTVAGGRKVQPAPTNLLETKANYFIGNDPAKWHTDVASYGRVTYRNVLDGVDLVYHGEEGQLEYDFIVAPGTDPSKVAMEVGGAQGLALASNGDLEIRTAHGTVLQPKPRVYQRSPLAGETDVRAGYRLIGARTVAFEIASYDRTCELVIDPSIVYSHYVGGSGTDDMSSAGEVAGDPAGNAYAVGSVQSSDFPVTDGSALGGTKDAAVVKLNAAGGVVWATYFGGDAADDGRGVAIDGSGNVYVTGGSASASLPGVTNVPYGGGGDAYIAKLDPTGHVVRSTFYGGTGPEGGDAIAVDTARNLYICGRVTTSTTLPGAQNTTVGFDAFVMKVATDGTAAWSYFLGGSNDEHVTRVVVDGTGANVYVAGDSSSLTMPHAVNSNAGSDNNYDAFAARLATAGIGSIVWTSFVGGSDSDAGQGLAIDSAGNLFLAGTSQSPSILGQPSHGGSDAFLAKLLPSGAPVWAKMFGTDNFEPTAAVAASGNNLYFGFTSASPDLAADGPAQRSAFNAYLAKLDTSGNQLYLYRVGGSGFAYVESVAVPTPGNILVAGKTAAPDLVAANNPFGGGVDGYVTLLTENLGLSPRSLNTIAPGESVTFTATDGVPPYTFSLPTNSSLGTLTGGTATTTTYTAGQNGGTAGTVDTIKVTDSTMTSATVNIAVGPTLKVTAGSTNLVPGGTTNLTVAGGSGTGYALTGEASCGTVSSTADPKVFTYHATTPNCGDTVHFVDSLGNNASTSLSVGSALMITGATSTTPPRSTLTLGTTGATGTVSWDFAGGFSPSGGSIDASGVYVAGPIGDVTDTIVATDDVDSVSVDIDVSSGVAITSGTSTAPKGSINLTATGGSGSGYAWSVTSAPPHGTIAGTVYTAGTTGLVSDTIKVTDSLGNSATGSIAITKAMSITPLTATVAPRGTTTFAGHDGAGAFVYSVDAPAHGTINAAGLYTAGTTGSLGDTVRVTDKNGAAATATVTISSGVSLASTATSLGPGGTATLTASGGSGSFPIASWSITNNSGATFTPTAGGTASYKAGVTGGVSDTITATDSLGNSKSLVISVGGGLAIDQGASTTTPPLGAKTFTAHGGQAPYSWSFVGGTAASGGTITTAGAYKAGTAGSVTDKVRVTDGNGVTADIDVVVGAGVTITATPAALNVAPRAGIAFSASGGSGAGYSWVIEKHSGADSSLDAATGAYEAGTIGNGTDVVHVTDSLGNTNSVNVVVGAPLALAGSVTHVPPRGTATFAASGGQTPYAYSVQNASSGTATISSSGAYKAGATPNVTDTILVTDKNGATATLAVAIDAGVTITPAAPSVVVNGTIDFAAAGGSNTGFTWSVVAASGGTINAVTGVYAAGATANKVDQVRVDDSLGNFAVVNVSVGGGVAINPAGGTVPPRGSIEFGVTGGTNAGFIWSMAAAPSGGTVDASGKYTAGTTPNVTDKIHVQDGAGNGVTVDVTVGAGLAIAPSATSTSPLGKLTFTTSGGSATGVTFKLGANGSGGTVTSDGHYTAGATGGTSDSVIATDSLGNAATATIAIGAALTVTPASVSVAPGATQVFNAAGGGGGYTFSFVENDSLGTLSSSGTYVAGHTAAVTDRIRVTDAAGAAVDVAIAVGAGITVSPATTSVATNGAVTFTATGGSGAGFVWSLSTNGSGSTIDASTGAYKAGGTAAADVVAVTDSLGNTATATVSVGGALAVLQVDAAVTPGGTITLTTTGGTGPFTWAITTNASGGTIDPTSGAYTAGKTGGVDDVVTVTDGKGKTATVTIHVGAAVRITPEAASAKAGDKIHFTASGGSGEGYAWSFQTNASGATIDAVSGEYTAGTKTGNDVIVAQDSLGNEAKAAAAVTTDGNAPPPDPSRPGVDVGDGGLNLTPNAPTTDDDGCNAAAERSSSTGALPLLAALVLVASRRRKRKVC